MAITKADCTEIKIDDTTFGGDTYYIRTHTNDKLRPLCFRPSKGKNNAKVADADGRLLRCSNKAGAGTDHVGTGSCSVHGGNNAGTLGTGIIDGRNATKSRSALANKIEEYQEIDKEQLFDITYELATVRAIFRELVKNISDYDDDTFGKDLFRITQLVGTIGTLVDKISSIEARNTLTISQVLYFRTVIADILLKYVTDPDMRQLAAQELVQRVGSKKEYARIDIIDAK